MVRLAWAYGFAFLLAVALCGPSEAGRPPGLEKKDKTPPGFDKGQKEGWRNEYPPGWDKRTDAQKNGWKNAVKKGRAWFPFEAACHSDHAETAPGGGWIAKEALEQHLGEVPELEKGEVSDVIKTDQGHHLVWRAGPS